MRRTAALGLGILAVAGLSLTACSSGSKPSPTAQVAPADALNNALAQLKTTGYDVTLTDSQSHGTGSVDPASSAATVQQSGVVEGTNITIAGTEIGPDKWVHLDLGALGQQAGVDATKWYHVDSSKLTGADAWPFELSGPDAFGVGEVLTAVTGVKATDATHLTGTVDLTQATGPAKPSDSDLQTAGAAAKTTPFTVVLDDKGRLASVSINADGFDKDLTKTIAFSNYGSPTAINPPDAASVVPAPDVIYQILNDEG
ncbi:MAG TPA: hypothetical protein VKB69_08825 [Micromonosporaceae bacterium]|nr:hypothetical protein [Micromonosporaceae bacterium]